MKTHTPFVLVTDELFLEHDTGGGEHPEISERMKIIWNILAGGFLESASSVIRPGGVDRELLLQIHAEEYLLRFEEAALSGKMYLDHPDNQICYDSYSVAVRAAGAALAGIDWLEENNSGHVFCCVRPPGHHAERGQALGFCFFNNCALAVRYWQKQYGLKRLAVIDWDAHHGNGIQAAFETDPEVYYFSIHEHPTFSFPGTGYAEDIGSAAGLGTTLNIPLPPGSSDAQLIKAVEQKIEPELEKFKPQAIVVAAGFDGHVEDDMSGLSYSTAIYGYLGRKSAAWAKKYCHNRVVSVLEGGYHLQSLSRSVYLYLQEICRNS